MNSYLKRAWAEIHLDRLKSNYEKCSKFLRGNTEFLAVVKANAYGHGDTVVAPYLQKLGIKWFAVSNINEAKHLRNCKVNGNILILGYTSGESVCDIADYDIIQTVTGYEHAKELSQACIKENRKIKVHISLDTGMGRIGVRHISAKENADECEKIIKLEGLDVKGMFTHFAVADSDDKGDIEYTNKQRQLIIDTDNELQLRGIKLETVHYLNSAGATYLKDDRSALARYGIMLYGLHPNAYLEMGCELEPVMELKTVVAHIKTISKDDYVSYGRTFKSNGDIKVATLTIGYADGYSRLLSSKAEVLINGKRAKIIGRVCMDQLMVDVTDIDVKVGDVATMFGRDGNDIITADELACIYGTIGYEIVCGISKRVPRVIIDGGKIVEVLE